MALNDKYVNTNQDVANYENITKFDSFYSNRYAEGFVNGYSFIFVTKPSLFIYNYKPTNNNALLNMAYENMTRDQYFTQFLASEAMNRSDRTIAEQLSFYDELNPEKQNFLPVFTNRARGFSVQDITMEQQDGFATKQGFRMPIPTNKTQSEASSNLTVPVFETPNLDVTKTIGLWVNYISNVTDGTFNANPRMVKNGIIDYMSSIYHFVLEPDGKTLKYWAKYTGCWPSQVPYSQMSYTRGEQTLVEVETNWFYTSKEDMNTAILEDFNKISLDIQDFPRDIDDDEYIKVKTNKYLSKDKIKEIPNYSPNFRGPLVFFSSGIESQSQNGTLLNDKFELTFGINTYEDTFTDGKFGEDYFFNTAEFFKSKLDE